MVTDRTRERGPLGGGVAVLAVVAVVALLGLARGSDPLFWLGFQELVILLLVLGVPLAAVFAVGGGRPARLEQWAPLPAATIRNHAVRWYAGKGWVLANSRSNVLALTRRPAPNAGLAVLLFLFGVVPGLVYLLLGGRTQAATILTTPVARGTDLEIIAIAARPEAVRFFHSLHDLV